MSMSSPSVVSDILKEAFLTVLFSSLVVKAMPEKLPSVNLTLFSSVTLILLLCFCFFTFYGWLRRWGFLLSLFFLIFFRICWHRGADCWIFLWLRTLQWWDGLLVSLPCWRIKQLSFWRYRLLSVCLNGLGVTVFEFKQLRVSADLFEDVLFVLCAVFFGE